MASDHTVFGRLVARSLAVAAVGAAATALSVAFVDRPVALAVNHYGIPQTTLAGWNPFRLLTLPPPIVQAWAPALLVLLAVRRALGPFRRGELALFTAAVAIIVADQFAESLRFLFGRLWPETWIDGNRALIPAGDYGFFPLHGGAAYADFPSGHMTRTLAAIAVFWSAFARGHWLMAAVAVAIAVSLVAMDYHFVGDVIAGSTLGAIVGAFAAAFAGLTRR